MKGFIFFLVIIAFIIVGLIVFNGNDEVSEDKMVENEESMEDDKMENDDSMMDDDSSMMEGDVMFTATLVDVSGGDATGTAQASYGKNGYTLTASFDNLRELGDDHFYEGWVVRKEGGLSVLSTGATTLQDGKHVNNFTSDINLSDHVLYVLTLEPDDGDPEPAEHILEGEFKKN